MIPECDCTPYNCWDCPQMRAESSRVEHCTCRSELMGVDPECLWARDGIGHVVSCPDRHIPCPCLPGSTSEAYCHLTAGNYRGYDVRQLPISESEIVTPMVGSGVVRSMRIMDEANV